MTGYDPVILFGIFVALVLNFFNGLTDAAQGVATVVATRALSPGKAVFLTGVCNMFGPFVFTTAVAATIGTAIVSPGAMTPATIIVGMLASITLVFSATRIGIPLSSSHALIGGIIGASVAAFGLSAVILPAESVILHVLAWGLFGALIGAIIIFFVMIALHGDVRLGLMVGAVCGAAMAVPILMVLGLLKLTGLFVVVLFIFISPVLGATIAFLFDLLVSHLFRTSRQNRMKRVFTPLQVLACLFQATGHGANDGMHAVGVITALLVSAGLLATFAVPTWVVLLSAIAIGLGTCFGGWKVVDRMAKGITKIRPYQGFCAGTSGSTTLAFVTTHGIPVSSNHVISGAIVGVGVTRGKNAVHWDVVRQMMTAWIITIPLAAVCAWAGYMVLTLVTPVLP
ncbi:inorganic phosphate transporter [Methanoregula sp.]|uniref:inorganic phosphate transporter n=1 Tax=Methanoregula sp. TaxID=2052170 RepID=UPI002B9EB731|nr:inorganic phosphate transporter [Methanoregula sp.]HVP96873.1 inorganic phosphate transporter [Methanoregula sp.]